MSIGGPSRVPCTESFQPVDISECKRHVDCWNNTTVESDHSLIGAENELPTGQTGIDEPLCTDEYHGSQNYLAK